MFEEVDKLSNNYQSYNVEYMINAWLSSPLHILTIIHPSISKLFCKLDEELLIGISPQNYFEGLPIRYSNIYNNTIYFGTGIHTNWDYGEVV